MIIIINTFYCYFNFHDEQQVGYYKWFLNIARDTTR